MFATVAPNAPPEPLSHASTDIGAIWIAGNLTMNDKLSITHATAKSGGAFHGVTSSDVCHSFLNANGLDNKIMIGSC